MAEELTTTAASLLDIIQPHSDYHLIQVNLTHAPAAVLQQHQYMSSTACVAELLMPHPGLQKGDLLLEVNGQLMLNASQQQVDAALGDGPVSLVIMRPKSLPLEAPTKHSKKEIDLAARLACGEECLRRLESVSARFNAMRQQGQALNYLEEMNGQLRDALEQKPHQLLREAVEGEAAATAEMRQMRHQLDSLQGLLEDKNVQLIALEREQIESEHAKECSLLRRRLSEAQLTAAKQQQQLERLLELVLNRAPQLLSSEGEQESEKGQELPPQPAPRKYRTATRPSSPKASSSPQTNHQSPQLQSAKIHPNSHKREAPPNYYGQHQAAPQPTSIRNLNQRASPVDLQNVQQPRDFDLLQQAAQLSAGQSQLSDSDYDDNLSDVGSHYFD